MAFNDETIAFIGAGVMGEAMIKGLLHQKLVKPERIVAADPHQARLKQLGESYGIHCTADNVLAAREADVLVLSVKPQVMDKVLPELRGRLDGVRLIVSIVAGVTLKTIADSLLNARVVRSMPNTPGQIGQGITVWTSSPDVAGEQRKQAEMLLGALGEQIFADDESFLDMATALSGSGPAYVFMFMEAMIDTGVHMGFRGGWLKSWSAGQSWGRWCMRGSRVCIRHSCGIRSPARAAPLPKLCMRWKRAGCAGCCPKAFGRPIGARRH